MENNKFEAVIAFDAAVKDLQDFCEENTDFNVVLMSNEYPFRVQFIPCDPAQTTMFETNNISEDGEVNDLVVTVGLSTYIKSTLKFKMNAKLLKKLIKRAEKVGLLYYQAFFEQYAGKEIRPTFQREADE